MKKIRYLIETVFAYILFAIFTILPLDWASSFGGFLGRFIGHNFAVSRKATDNLKKAMPELSDDEIQKTIIGMWDNLGRIMAEYPHLPKLEKKGRVIVENDSVLLEAEKKGKPIIFITGHIGNWEVLHFIVNARAKNEMALVFRAPNNPWVDKLLQRIRNKGTKIQIAKGAKGAKEIVKLIKKGLNVGMLVDQKMNEGIPIPFFGRNAMTVTSVAQLGLKYDCTIIPVCCKRLSGANFKVTFYDEIELFNSGQTQKDIEANMRYINEMLEGWIREDPEQWLWLHRRWPHSRVDKEFLEAKLK